eukprot:scaffold192772_cov12-Tisochrysis_lutea.AAC.1
MSGSRKYNSAFPRDAQGSREHHYPENGVRGHLRYAHDMLCASIFGVTGHECTAKFQKQQSPNFS